MMNEIAFLMVLVALYFFPIILAFGRGHRSAPAIAVVNVLFGWTLIGWIWALIWSLTGNVREPAQ